MRYPFTLKLLIPFFVLYSFILYAQPQIEFTQVNPGGPSLSQITDITGAGDGSGRLFIAEKRGTIRIIENGEVLEDFFLDISEQVQNSGERGLLGLAFHPNFPETPYFYVNYVIKETIINRISRFTVNPENPNDAIEDSEIYLIEQAGVQSNHKAGDIAFGPDGYLYIGMGDGGGGGDPSDAAQDPSRLLGKMLRIDVDNPVEPFNYGIPADNPYVGTEFREEIYYIGLRNPWRISFDRATGDFWVPDVGQDLWEEVNVVPAGSPGGLNFGWDCKESFHDFQEENCEAGTEFFWPIFEYPHNCGTCPNGKGVSITGGFVYRGNDYPSLQGYFIFADYISNYVWVTKEDEGNPGEYITHNWNYSGLVNGIVTFGEDDNGELYAGSLGGDLWRVSALEVEVPLINWSIGTKWYYETITNLEPITTSFILYEIIDSEAFQGQDAFVIQNSQSATPDYAYIDENRVYFWDPIAELWQLTYSFDEIDSYTTEWVSVCGEIEEPATATINILSTGEAEINGEMVRVQEIAIVNSGTEEDNILATVYDGVGLSWRGLTLPLGESECIFGYRIGQIRCFESDSAAYTFVDYPCDTTWTLVTSVKDITVDKFRILPNPSNGDVRIEPYIPNSHFEIFTVHGGLVKSGILTNEKIHLSEPGLYVIQISTPEAREAHLVLIR